MSRKNAQEKEEGQEPEKPEVPETQEPEKPEVPETQEPEKPEVPEFKPALTVLKVADLKQGKDFSETILWHVKENIRLALEARRGECVPKIVLMGEAAWYYWSNEESLVRLIAAKKILNKTKINEHVDVRLTPGIGDVVAIA
jgi:hypothetical protein